MKIGILGAMEEEIHLLGRQMTDSSSEIRGKREYLHGQLFGHDVYLVFSRWGKVAASATATTLIERYGVDYLIFTGVAGGVDPQLNIGDKQDLIMQVTSEALKEFAISAPKVVCGTIASGDQFISSSDKVQQLREKIPNLCCVEMEGAAVAQVAYEYGIPCLVLRTVSDKADDDAIIDFPRFITSVAAFFTCGSVLRLLKEW